MRSTLVPRSDTTRTPTPIDANIERRKTCVLALFAEPRTEHHEEDHGEAGDEATDAQHRKRAARERETDRCARHDRMREDVADKTHAPQQKQRAERTAGDRKRTMRATSAVRMKAYSAKGATRMDQRLMSTAHRAGRHRRPQPRIWFRAERPDRPRRSFSGVSAVAVSPQAIALRASKRVAGKIAEDLLEVVQGDHHRTALAMPALHEPQQVVARGGVDAGERFVEKDDRRILHDDAGEQGAAELARPRARRACGQQDRRGRRPAGRSCRAAAVPAGHVPRTPILAQPPSATNSRTEIGKSRSMESLCGR